LKVANVSSAFAGLNVRAGDSSSVNMVTLCFEINYVSSLFFRLYRYEFM